MNTLERIQNARDNYIKELREIAESDYISEETIDAYITKLDILSDFFTEEKLQHCKDKKNQGC